MGRFLVEDGAGLLKYIQVSGDGSSTTPFILANTSAEPSAHKTIISRFLDTVGDGSGVKEAVGNYAAAAEDFFIAPAAGEVFIITRMLVYVEDSGSFDSGAYGNGITLTNGINVVAEIDGVDQYLTDADLPVKTTGEWAALCYDAIPSSFGSGNEYLTMRWTFAKSGTPVVLIGDTADKLIVRLNDTFVALVKHRFLVQGYVAS